MSALIGLGGLRPLVRSVSWSPVAIALSVSAVFVLVRRGVASPAPMQAAAFLLGTAIAFSVDDPAFETMAASPVSFLVRRLSRVALTLVPSAVGFGLLITVQGSATAPEAGALVTMFAGTTGLGLAVSGAAGRESGRGGVLAPPVVLGLLMLSSVAPRQWRPLPLGDVPGGFDAIALRWGTAAVIGVLVFLWSSRDPAR